MMIAFLVYGFLVHVVLSNDYVIRTLYFNTTVYNHFSVTTVTSEFSNLVNDQTEVVFTLSIPPEAYVMADTFRLTTELGVFSGYVLERNIAEYFYEESDNSASLVTLSGPNTYSYSTKIDGLSDVKFEVSYQELLARRDSFYTCETFIQVPQEVEDFQLLYNIHEDFGVFALDYPIDTDIRSASSTDVLLWIDNPSFTPDDLFSKTVRYRTDNSLVPKEGEFFLRGEYFAHLMNPDDWSGDAPPMTKSVIFVIDVSGSMAGTPLENVKLSFQNMIDQLDETDKFALVSFSDDYTLWEGESLKIGTYDNKESGKSWVNQLSAGGSTNLYAGVSEGLNILNEYAEENDIGMICVLTDGETNLGIIGPDELRAALISENPLEYMIHTIGFGLYTYNLLESIALDSGGMFVTVTPELDVVQQLSDFFSTIKTVTLKNVEMEYNIVNTEGVDISETSRKSFKTYYNGSEIIVSGKLYLHPDGHDDLVKFMINMTAETSTGEEISLGMATDLSIDENNVSSGVPTKQIYQNQKMQELIEDYVSSSSDTGYYFTALAFAIYYQIVTPLTSLVVRDYNLTSSSESYDDMDDDGAEYDDDVEYDGVETCSKIHGSFLFLVVFVFLFSIC